MGIKFVFLWTDILVYVLVATVLAFVFYTKCHEHLRAPWRQVVQRKLGMVTLVILLAYVAVALLDSVHFHLSTDTVAHSANGTQEVHYSYKTTSLLDVLIAPLGEQYEKTSSAPFATHQYGIKSEQHPPLAYAGQYGVVMPLVKNVSIALMLSLVVAGLVFRLAQRGQKKYLQQVKDIFHGNTDIAWREAIMTLAVILLIIAITMALTTNYHVLGTDKVGHDVFYASLKSIRTGLIIGTLTTLLMLPFAAAFGISAGYFGGRIDDVVQFTYTTLSSIPGVLLISAAILALQVFIANHPEMFPTLASRADARLLALCAILGITSWTGLCRVLRGEALKLRDVDYIQAAITLGTKPYRILTRHILPNVMYIILITVVLDFSGLVLAEAVLSYVGVGVDPTTLSWGNMINSARLELAREPIVWWPLLSAFSFMFVLVLAANLFADRVRDAFDPRLKNVEK